MVGAVGLLFVGAAWVYKTRTRRKLRMPTKVETTAIAVPLGRIANRHANLSILGPDVADVIEAGSALGAYLNNGPLGDGPAVDPGLSPHVMQHSEQEAEEIQL